MKIGKLNFILGACGLLLASFGGVALGGTFDKYAIKEGYHMLSEIRFYLREGHSHGMPMAFLNLIFALYVDRLNLSDRVKKIGSIATACAFLLPIGLFAKGLAGAPANFPPIGLPGILGFIIGVSVLIAGALKMKAE